MRAWGAMTFPLMVFLLVFMIAVVAFIVYVERSERRIPVQYAKRVVGRKVMGGQSTHLPLRVNAGGVMPVIFASSILTLPQTIGYGMRNSRYFGDLFRMAGMGRAAVHRAVCGRNYFLRILLRVDRFQSQRSRRQHAQVWRIHSGHSSGEAHGGLHQRSAHADHAGRRAVSDHHFVYSGVDDHWYPLEPLVMVWLGDVFECLPNWITNGLGVTFYFGGTSLLIVVGVAMDTVQQIEAQLIMRHYDGFTPRSGRIRGRRTW